MRRYRIIRVSPKGQSIKTVGTFHRRSACIAWLFRVTSNKRGEYYVIDGHTHPGRVNGWLWKESKLNAVSRVVNQRNKEG